MTFRPSLVFVALSLLACGGGQVSSEEQARRAYLGLDLSVAKAMQLGFDGFNSASSANIATQTTSGAKSGTLSITGQVDQGASDNKGMRLKATMTNYSDGELKLDGGNNAAITYDTLDGGSPAALELSLKNIPNGTFSGTLVGEFGMTGGLTGTVKLELAMSGDIEDGGNGTVRRKPGTTVVTGKAIAGTAEFQVNVTQ